MDAETKLLMHVAEMILNAADEQRELTRSDFQSRVDVIARKIIEAVRKVKQPR
jgi:hypothetical protein